MANRPHFCFQSIYRKPMQDFFHIYPLPIEEVGILVAPGFRPASRFLVGTKIAENERNVSLSLRF